MGAFENDHMARWYPANGRLPLVRCGNGVLNTRA